jgi:HEAT repeat protein/ankyrin repeat protein
MFRSMILLLCLAVLPAAAFDLEKWVDDLANRQMESWKKESLETVVKGRDPKDRLEAIERLSYTDADAVAVFAVALSDSDAKVRQAAASKLWSAEKRAEPYRPQLVKALEDPDANVVAYAAGALQAIGMKEAELAAPRKRVLVAPEASVTSRFLVARNLVGYEPPMQLVGPMIAYLEQNTRDYTGSVTDRNRENVGLVERAMERMVKNTRERALIPPLSQALVETRNGHIPLLKALAAFEPRPEGWTSTLLRQLEHPNARVRYAALGHLRDVKSEKEIATWTPRAAQMLQDPDKSVRSEALWALGSAKGLAASQVEQVVAALNDPEPSVRRSAARALGEIAEANQAIPAATRARLISTARPALDAAMQDADKDVREEARSALRNVNGRDTTMAVAAAAPSTPPASESTGMAVLRARKVTFEESSFYRALSEVDMDLIRAFLDAGMSPSASLSGMGPPIRVMLFSSNACAPNVRPTKAETKAVVRLLLDRGADIHAADPNGNNAITEAASKGCDRELIRMLIKAGADIHSTKHGSGLAPFEMGLWSGHDGLDEFLAAGYRLPPAKVKMYLEGYKDRPAAVAMVKKAAARGGKPK